MLLTFIGHSTGGIRDFSEGRDIHPKTNGKELGVDQSTISRELKRGKTQQMNSDRTYYNVYLADAGSRVYQNHAQRNTLNILVPFLKSSLKQLLRRMTSHESIVSTHSFTHIVERILMNVYRVQKLFIR